MADVVASLRLHLLIVFIFISVSFCLQAKKEMYDVKKQRLCLAQDEYKHLNNALSTLAASRTSRKFI